VHRKFHTMQEAQQWISQQGVSQNKKQKTEHVSPVGSPIKPPSLCTPKNRCTHLLVPSQPVVPVTQASFGSTRLQEQPADEVHYRFFSLNPQRVAARKLVIMEDTPNEAKAPLPADSTVFFPSSPSSVLALGCLLPLPCLALIFLTSTP
jgi:hypothetical protein